MNITIRKFLLATAALALTAQTPPPAPSAAQLPNQPADKPAPPAAAGAAQAEALRVVDLWLDSVQVHNRLPSLTAAVVQGDRIVWANGYGTIDAARTVGSPGTELEFAL